MNCTYIAGSRARLVTTLLASAAIAATGCSNMTSTATSSGVRAAIKVPGKIHGGNQPVAGAAVNLYFAGQQAYAAGAQLVATTTSSSDGSGGFQFILDPAAPNDGSSASFSCPAGNPYLFVVAKGGTTVNTPGAQPNPDAEFIAPLGRCTNISGRTIYMSEVVTVATMAAIHQYMNSTTAPIETSVGADGIFVADQALGNSFDNVDNMVSLTTGLGNETLTKTGGTGATGATLTVTPELTKLNQLANIISACINQSGGGSSACTSIYANAAPPASASSISVGAVGAPATNLLTALYYIFANPTNGSDAARLALFNTSPAVGAPYQPTLTAVPTDWTLALKFTATGTCTNSGQPFLANPSEITVGQRGNLFVTNAQAGTGSVVEIDGRGVPASCFPVTVGASATAATAAGIALDINKNVWVGSSSSNDLYRYTPISASSSRTTLHITTAAPIISLTTDGFGDIFFSATDGNLYEIQQGAMATTPSTPVQINSLSVGTGAHIMIDSFNGIWASSGANYVTYTQGDVTANGLVFPALRTFSVPATDTTLGIASTSSSGNGVYFSSVGGPTSTITSVIRDNSNGYAVRPGFPVSGGGLDTPTQIALDGSQSVWSANAMTGGLSGFDRDGRALTPSTGFVKDASFLGPQSSIVVDASGNIWVGLSNSSTITEIVGAASPIFQPYSDGLDPVTNRFQQLP